MDPLADTGLREDIDYGAARAHADCATKQELGDLEQFILKVNDRIDEAVIGACTPIIKQHDKFEEELEELRRLLVKQSTECNNYSEGIDTRITQLTQYCNELEQKLIPVDSNMEVLEQNI